MKKGIKIDGTFIAIVLGATIVVSLIVAALIVSLNNSEHGSEKCPPGKHRVCGPLGDGREICGCYENMDVQLKPMLYLYPESETELNVELGAPENLSTSYPKYSDGWNVLASPDGSLTDLKTGRELYGLYWEGFNGNFPVTDEGFIVRGDEASDFLEEKLGILGLNEREAEEFIVYWLPKMEGNEFNYVRFASLEEINEYMPLRISPSPDTIIRVLMITRPVDNELKINEQVLEPAPERNGFTVIEWGGSVSSSSIK